MPLWIQIYCAVDCCICFFIPKSFFLFLLYGTKLEDNLVNLVKKGHGYETKDQT